MKKKILAVLCSAVILLVSIFGSIFVADAASPTYGGLIRPSVTPVAEYTLPAYTGEAEDYSDINVMNVKTAVLAGPITVGKSVSESVLHSEDGHDEQFKAIDSLVGITKLPSIEMTEPTEASSAEDWMSYAIFNCDYTKNKGGNGGLIYIKTNSSDVFKFRVAWNYKKDKNSFGSGSVFSGKIQILAKDAEAWEDVDVYGYWIDLPANFEGYVRYGYERIGLSKDQGKVQEDPNWGIVETWVMFQNLKAGAKVEFSTPMIESNWSAEAVPNIAFIGDETKIARNIFTGEVVKPEEAVKPEKPMVEGDIIDSLPEATFKEIPTLADGADLLTKGKASIEWKAFDGATKYEVRVFKKTAADSGYQYQLFKTISVTENKVDIAELNLQTRYCVVVHAFDVSDKRLATYDFLAMSTVNTSPKPNTDTNNTQDNTADAATDTDEGHSIGIIIAIVAGVVVLAAVVVVFFILKKKRTPAEATVEIISEEASEETAE